MSKIFISYRRKDSRLVTSRIYDRLRDAFGKHNIFKDVDNIPPGKDFRGVLREATARCEIMLVIIGPKWIDIRDDAGNRRLENPDDFVRLEVETGLQRDDMLVIPVLVENAQMPSAGDLPDTLRELAYNNAFIIDSDRHFHRDVDGLIAHTRKNVTGGVRIPSIDWRWIVGVVFIPIIAAIIGGLIQNPEFFGLGSEDTTEVVQATANTDEPDTVTDTPQPRGTETPPPLSEEEMGATAAAGAFATLTANAPTDTPSITLTPSNTPISQTDLERTVQAEIFATATSTQLTAEAAASQTQRAEQTQVYVAGVTATYSFNLSQTLPATNTLTATSTPDMPEPERVALDGVDNNEEWENLVGDDGYMRVFDGVEMVLVPAGCFVIGSDTGDEQNNNDVCFDDPFWVDKYEVTNEQFGSTGCNQWSSESVQPRNCVDWFDALSHCRSRNAILPTEAEWEYAARGPNELVYSWGNDYIADYVIGEDDPTHGDMRTAPVGSRPAGASWVGALDMIGNVWEWTRSTYQDYPYDANDGRNDNMGSKDDHLVIRGGSFESSSYYLRSANRNSENPDFGYRYIGFRCIRSYK